MPRRIVDTAIPLALRDLSPSQWRWVVRNGMLFRRFCRFAYHLNRFPGERGELTVNDRIDIGGEG